MSMNRIAGVSGVALLVLYSVIMMATEGGAATYAWLILIAGIALVVVAVRRSVAGRGARDDG